MQNKNRLATYLTAGLGAGCFAGNADATIVNLDISSISGPNAGLASGASMTVTLASLDSGLTGDLLLTKNSGYGSYRYTGLKPGGGAGIASGSGYADPQNLSLGEVIDSNRSFSSQKFRTSFVDYGSNTVSPGFGAGSFIGFKSGNELFGWLEVTWNASAREFEILGGAYEDAPGVGIQAGATAAAVPEPASVLGTIGLLAGGAFVRRRKVAA